MNSRSIKKFLKGLAAFAMPVVLFAIACISFPNIKPENLPLLLRQSVAPCIIAWGVSFEFKAGNWDFSLGSVCVLSSIVGGNLCEKYFGSNIFALFFLCVAIAVLMGVLTSTIYRLCRIPTILVTIGMIFIYESLSTLVFNGKGIMLGREMTVFNDNLNSAIIFIILFIVTYLLYSKTKLSFNIRAAGKNPDVAFFNGVNVRSMKCAAMIIAAAFAGCYGFYMLCCSGVQRSVSGMGSMPMVFDAMMCVFMAFAIEKLVNVVFGVCIGAFTLQIIKFIFLAVGFPNQYNTSVIACIVLLLMVINSGKLKLPKLKKNKAAVIQ